MKDEETRVIECARRMVAAGRAWCDARGAADRESGHGMRSRLMAALTANRALVENNEAELALMDAIDAFEAIQRDQLKP